MVLALSIVSVFCVMGWVNYLWERGGKLSSERERDRLEELVRSERKEAVAFVRFLQRHPHLLPEAINTRQRIFGDDYYLNTGIKKQVEEALKRVAQHKKDLDLLDVFGVE